MPPEEMQTGAGASSGQQGQQPPSGDQSSANQQNQSQQQQPNRQQSNAAGTQVSGQQPNDDGQQPGTDSVQNPEAKKYADEAAKWRKQARDQEKRLAELEAAEQKRKDAELTDLQRAQKAAQEAEQKLATERMTARQRIVRAEVRVQAAAVGIKPELAARLIDTSEIAADADDDEMAKEIGKLLKQLAKDNPELVRQPNGGGQGQQSGQNNGQQSNGNTAANGTPNPGATAPERQNGPVTVTANQYLDKAFQQEFKTRYGMSVQDAVMRGKATLI